MSSYATDFGSVFSVIVILTYWNYIVIGNYSNKTEWKFIYFKRENSFKTAVFWKYTHFIKRDRFYNIKAVKQPKPNIITNFNYYIKCQNIQKFLSSVIVFG